MKKLEDKYQKLTHKEHVLHRPDMYIGSNVNENKSLFLVNNIDNFENLKINIENIEYNSGFIKIFDEILTNCSDHSIRTNKVKYIKVNVYKNHIIIENDGPGIPIEIHSKEKIYIPELLFGNLLTSENYNDEEERYTGGRNGIGATLTNIYSKIFEIETADGKKIYNQKFTNNLSKTFKPIIKKSKKNYTKITFYPDFDKFNMTEIDNNIEKILLKRTIDISSYNPNVKVYYNDKLIPIKSFKDYMKLFLNDNKEFIYEKINDYWEFGITISENETFISNSMVNGISTINGGTHVNYISNQILNIIKDYIIKNNKDIKIRPMDIKSHLFLFLNCKIINPTFENQTKETLTTRITKELNGDFIFTESFIKKLTKSKIVEEITNKILLKNHYDSQKDLNKKSKSVKIKKLNDATAAGTNESNKCHLFITEGDCLQENTMITIIRNGEKMEIEIKDIKLNDAVITHNNNIGYINNISKKIKKSVKIKLKNNTTLICSKNHKWFIYDKINKKFSFKKTDELDIKNHRMIINKNVNFKDFIKIKDIVNYKHDKYDKIICLENKEEILSTNEHKFSVFNIENQLFEMVKCKNLDNNNHYIVNYTLSKD